MKKEQPKISIVMPSYNATEFISQTLKSALAQDYPNYEIVVVDDGSTDKTADLVLKFKRSYPKIIKYVYQENKGLAGARNCGIGNSSGQYFLFLDSDDLIEKNHLSSLMAKSKKFSGNKKIAFSDTKLLLEGKVINKTYKQIAGFKEGQGPEELLHANTMPGIHSVLFPREVFGLADNFDQELIGAEDHDIYIRATLAGYRFYSTHLPTAIYRIRVGSMSFGRKQERRVIKARIQIANKYLSRDLEEKTKKEFLRKKQIAFIDLGRWYIRTKKYDKAKTWFKKAQKIDLELSTRKKTFITLAKNAPFLIHLYWQIKDGFFPPAMQQEIDKHIGKEAYESQT